MAKTSEKMPTTNAKKESDLLFEGKVDVPRIGVGKTQTFETLINEEALLLAKFLRNERRTWALRIVVR